MEVVITITLRPFKPQENSPGHPVDRSLGEPKASLNKVARGNPYFSRKVPSFSPQPRDSTELPGSYRVI